MEYIDVKWTLSHLHKVSMTSFYLCYLYICLFSLLLSLIPTLCNVRPIRKVNTIDHLFQFKSIDKEFKNFSQYSHLLNNRRVAFLEGSHCLKLCKLNKIVYGTNKVWLKGAVQIHVKSKFSHYLNLSLLKNILALKRKLMI